MKTRIPLVSTLLVFALMMFSFASKMSSSDPCYLCRAGECHTQTSGDVACDAWQAGCISGGGPCP